MDNELYPLIYVYIIIYPCHNSDACLHVSKRDPFRYRSNQPRSHMCMYIVLGLNGSVIWTILVYCLTQRHCMLFPVAQSTILMLRLEYSGKTRSIAWLLMCCFFALSYHQQLWYWLYRINRSSYSTRNSFNNVHHLNFAKLTHIYFIFSQTNLGCKELIKKNIWENHHDIIAIMIIIMTIITIMIITYKLR